MELIKKDFLIGGEVAMSCFILIRMIDGKQQFLFKAFDVAKFLGYELPNKAISDLVPKECKMSWGQLTAGVPGISFPQANWLPNTTFITEAGVYALFVESKLPQSTEFVKWLFNDVIHPLRVVQYSEKPTHSPQHSSGFLYIVATKKMEDEDIYLIGSTPNLEERMFELSASSSEYYRQIYVLKCHNKLLENEQVLHTVFEKFKIENGYYKIPKNTIISIMNQLIVKANSKIMIQ